MKPQEDSLDRAIDEAARQLMAGEPSARFEAKVMSRIETPDSTIPVVSGFRLRIKLRRTAVALAEAVSRTWRGRGISGWPVATVSAAAAVVVLIAMFSRQSFRPVPDESSAKTQAIVSETALGQEAARAEQPGEARASAPARFTDRAVGRSGTNLETLTLPPIEEPPIVVESIALDPLELPGIEMARLELARLALDPVTVANTQETP